MNQFEIVFEGDNHRHFVDNEAIKFTACGLPLIDYHDWTIDEDTKGICWRCVTHEMNKDELNTLKGVLDAATGWSIDPNNPKHQATLLNAVDAYWAWANYEQEDTT